MKNVPHQSLPTFILDKKLTLWNIVLWT